MQTIRIVTTKNIAISWVNVFPSMGSAKYTIAGTIRQKNHFKADLPLSIFSVVCAIMISPYEKSDWMCSFFHINSI